MILDQILGYLFMLINFAPFICFFACLLLSIPLGIWTIIDLSNLQAIDGNTKRGIKIWSQPLTTDQFNYLDSIKENIIEENIVETVKFWWPSPSFILKNGDQILISANNDKPIPIRTVPVFGYINLATHNPILEFRSSLPFHLLAFIMTFAFLPIIIGPIINFLVEKQAIENFLAKKISQDRINRHL